MVVDRAHFEDSFAGELERADLQEHRKTFDYPNTANGDQDKFVTREHCCADDKAAKEERACVAHKYLCGVEIEHQKGEHSAKERSTSERNRIIGEIDTIEEEHHTYYQRDASCKAVDSVGQICTVNDIYNSKKHYYIIENAELEFAERSFQRCIKAVKRIINEQINRNRKELQYHFLRCAQAFITFFEELDIVINKSDQALRERKTQKRESVFDNSRKIGAERIIDFEHNHTHRESDDGSDYEKESAEVGSSLFTFMPRGSDFQNLLTEFDLS